MDEHSESGPADAGGGRRTNVGTSEDTTAREILLNEARTAANRQLLQLNKLDDAGVRTVRLAFILAGILAGGSRLASFPELGVFGALGTWSLVGSLLGSLYIYGTSRLFVGSGPADLNIDYEESPTTGSARVEVIRRYETGISHNWRVLYVNGFVLGVSRLLLALTVLFIVVGIVRVT